MLLFDSGNNNHGPPPLAEIVAATANNNNNNNNDQRKTHIEVCIRIRPMLEGSIRESSNGFLLASSSSSGNNSNSNTPGSSNNNNNNSNNSLIRTRNSCISRLGLFRQTSSTSRKEEQSQQSHQQQQQQQPQQQQPYAWKVDDDKTTVRQTTDLIAGRTHQYTLDHVYGPDSSTRDVYEHSVQDLVHAAMDGYHTSVLAYGQTSTGKTHTITGTCAQQPGILPLAVQECFDYLQNNNNHREYLMRVSYLEVYKENIRDLLANNTSSSTSTPTPIRLFESPEQGLIIRGLREQVVTNAEQVFALLRQGESRRQVGATYMNQHSSRSHTIVRIWIESRATTTATASSGDATSTGATAPTTTSSSTSSLSSSVTGQTTSSAGAGAAGGVGAVRISSLSIVDLAGSESVRLSKDASRQKEGHYINQSLMALGKVVYALSEAATTTTTQNIPTISKLFKQQQQHIPYRDSKLTRLLQPSLSGNAQVVLICCISPVQDHVEESHNTFKFAMRAKKIPQRATIDEVDGDGDDKAATLLQSYRQEIEDLKQQLKEAREQQNSLLLLQQQQSSTATAGNMEETEDEVHELVHAIQAMERLILKSKPNNGSSISTSTLSTTPARSSSCSTDDNRRPEDLLDDDDDNDDDNDDDFDQQQGELMALANVDTSTTATQNQRTTGIATPMRRSGIPMSSSRSSSSTTMTTTPMHNNNNNNSTLLGNGSSSTNDAQLSRELGRIQSLLGSVLKKRKQQNANQQNFINNSNNNIQVDDGAEVRHLRAKLEQQEISTSLRKADSSFLQQQLQEKDDLLQEVSNILEQLEARQVQLEQENAQLKQQLAAAVLAAAEITAVVVADHHNHHPRSPSPPLPSPANHHPPAAVSPVDLFNIV